MFTLVYPPESPCGCGSGREFGKCCLKDGKISLDPKPLDPPKPQTVHKNRKCILNWTADCCSSISGDHIVSRSVLRVLTESKITISTSRFSREHSIDSSALKTKKLCRRHNSALSPIDSEAARFFKAFAAINDSLSKNSSSQKLYFFHGIDIERWMLKTLLMTYFARLGNVTPEQYKLPAYVLNLFHGDLAEPLGLYVPTSTNPYGKDFFVTENAASISLLTDGDLVAGVTITLGGFSLTLIISGSDEHFRRLATNYTYRPSNLVFFKDEDVHYIQLAYPNWQGKAIVFSHGNPDAKLPSN